MARVPSNREPDELRKSSKALMYSVNSNSQSQQYLPTSAPTQSAGNVAVGTPIRGQSGSTRRKIVAQQSQQHF